MRSIAIYHRLLIPAAGREDPLVDDDAQKRFVEFATEVLSVPHRARHVEAADVPDRPGLYAIHAAPEVWVDLGLPGCDDRRPLYVGKSESSLADRDVETHFCSGRTGSSTVRRSLAGLLADRLELSAQPRNPKKPSHFANFSLERAGDDRLTEWMRARLTISAVDAPVAVNLTKAETAVLGALSPALNLQKARSPWRRQVSQARRRLADDARAVARRSGY